jgi:hypothetical protein
MDRNDLDEVEKLIKRYLKKKPKTHLQSIVLITLTPETYVTIFFN